jgi:hypothetical protein
MKKIKIICSWTIDTKNYFKKQLKEEKYWDNYVLTNEKIADFYVIINKPSSLTKDNYYEDKKTIYLTMEPSFSKLRNNFSKYVNEKSDIYYHNINGLEWWISKNYDQLLKYKIEKTKKISAFISDNYSSENQIKRVNFSKYLDQIDNLDLFGKLRFPEEDSYNIIKNLKNYKGAINIKDNGLFPYKYTIVCENACEKNYFSEKLSDGILSECLCFYHGCTNILDFINPNAIIIIDLENPSKALETIINSIKQNEWERRIDIIRKEKLKILNELQLIPTIVNIIKKKLSDKK